MTFTFSPKQLEWLSYYAKQLAVLAQYRDEATARTATKMRYKFSPQASKVFLGGKERALLSEMVSYRLSSLAEVPVAGPEVAEEMKLVQSILEAVNG